MLRKFRETLKNKQRGAIMVFFAILVPLFLGAIGLAVDAGFLYMQKAKLQDVADATALAGAGHLNDENRETQVANAVVAFAGANGYKDKDEAASSNFQELADKADASSVTLEENAAWKIAYAIDTGMKDKDAKNGEQRDHVRVVILKRVPTFFIRMLFPEQREVVVKAVAAAEYVEGEEQPVDYDGAKIMCGPLDLGKVDKNSFDMKNGQDFSMYIGSGLDYNKLPSNSVGTIYGPHQDYNTPSGWQYVCNTRADSVYYKNGEEEKKAAQEAITKYDSEMGKAEQEAKDRVADMNSYINPNGSNKRYIGFDNNGKFINNIRESDEEIELFMNGTDTSNTNLRDSRCWLTNLQLKNVKKINTLITTKFTIISTQGKKFGRIYCVGDFETSIGGENNYFYGKIYATPTWQFLGLGGVKNHFGAKGEVSVLCTTTVKLGVWRQIFEDEKGYMQDTWPEKNAEQYSDWKIHFDGNGSGSGGSSSGSSGSGASKAHVRLVI